MIHCKRAIEVGRVAAGTEDGTEERTVGPAETDPPTDSDPEVTARVLEGDRGAFATIVDRYQEWVYRMAYRMTGSADDAQELTQDIFLRVYTRLGRYERDRPFRPWLGRLAANLILNRIRRRRGHAQLPADGNFPGREEGPAETSHRHEVSTRVQAAVLRLPPRYRLAITLRYLEDLGCADIARILGTGVNTVKTWLFRAREMMRGELRELWGDEVPRTKGP